MRRQTFITALTVQFDNPVTALQYGARYVLAGTELKGYDAANSARIAIDLQLGTIFAVSNGSTCIWGIGPGSSTGVKGDSMSGSGVYGSSIYGYGGEFAGNSSKAPLKLTSSGSIPTDRTVGSIAFIGGWLCFANGTDWYQSDGTKLT